MALSSYALTTVAGLKAYKGFEGASADTRLEEVINAATSYIESQTNRQFITRGAVTEYHSLDREQHTIILAQAPLISITSVHESTDSPRVYDGTTALTTATEFLAVSTPREVVIRRLSNSELTYWALGYRTVQVIYAHGYASVTALPADLVHLANKLAYAMFKEAERGWDGVTSISDAQGSTTRIGRMLTSDMKAILDSYTSIRFERTWEAA